jgi:hypothetical protein
MAKANITTPDGTTINLEGTSDEIAALMAKFGLVKSPAPVAAAAAPASIEPVTPAKSRGARKKRGGKTTGARKGKAGPAALIAEMIANGSFKKPKLFSDIRSELAQSGYYYSRTSIGPAVKRALINRELRRIKQDGKWAYVA